jgi:carboxypeptidase C (cathepsin A)
MRSLKRKLQLIELLGGCCQKWGYCANKAALHFHHSDPDTKSIKLDMRILSNRNWETIVAEAGKCELLCSNCHAETHHPELALHEVQRMLSGASR